MTKLYQIEKKTPATNWYVIQVNLTAEAAAEMMGDIYENYFPEALDLAAEVRTDARDALENPDRGYYVWGEHLEDADGSTGDYIQYRAVEQ